MNMRTRLFALLLALAGAVHAADAPRYGFDCDAPAGNYSEWTRTVSTKHLEIAGKLLIGELYEHKKWRSGASVFLRRSSDHAAVFGIRLFADSSSAKSLTVEMLKIGGRDAIGTVAKKKDQWLPFSLKLQPDGALSVTLGDTKGTVNIGAFTPETFELVCSTGSFEFADVTVKELD